MNSRTRRFAYLGVAAAMLVLAVWAVWARLEKVAPRPSVTAADGTLIEVAAVTYGPRHEWGGDGSFKKLLRKNLPVALLRALPAAAPGGSTTTSGPSVAIWFTERAPGGGYVNPAVQDLALVTDGGQLLEKGGYSSSGVSPPVRWMEFETFPRRQRDFELRFVRKGERFSLRVPNPQPAANVPEWKASALPQTQRSGDLETTLRKLELRAQGSAPGQTATRWYAQPSFDFAYEGERRTDWFSARARYHDPTGNVGWSTGLFSEPVWKLQVTVHRATGFPFPPKLIRDLGKARLPGAGEFVELAASPELRRDGLSVALLLGAGRFTIESGKVTKAEALAPGERVSENSSSSDGSRGWTCTLGSNQPRLLVVAEGAPSQPFVQALGGETLARGKDAAGRVLWSRGGGSSSSSSSTWKMIRRQFEFEPKPESGEVEFALVETGPPWEFEFLVPAPSPPGP